MKPSVKRTAFSLLEVVVSLAILTIALTACLGVVDLGIQGAREARERSRAQEICESVMGLITSGVLDVNSVAGAEQSVANIWSAAGVGSTGDELDLQSEEDAWLCSVNSEPGEQQNLLKVTVRVTASSGGETPVEFALVRWLLDPTYVQSLDQAQAQANSNSSTNSSSQSNPSSQSGSSGSPSGSSKTMGG